MAQKVSVSAFSAAVNAKQVSNAAATLIESVTEGRKAIAIQNLGPNAIWIGFTKNVTNVNGFRIAAGDPPLALDLGNGVQVYAIADNAAQISPADTRVLETR